MRVSSVLICWNLGRSGNYLGQMKNLIWSRPDQYPKTDLESMEAKLGFKGG